MIKSIPPYIHFFTLIVIVDPRIQIGSDTARARLWLFSLTQGTDATVCRYLVLNSSIEQVLIPRGNKFSDHRLRPMR